MVGRGFYVYVIESPSAADVYEGRSEGALIKQATSLDGVGCVCRTALNLDTFARALTSGLSEAMRSHEGACPALHISAHGCADGVGLSDGTLIPWDRLRQVLVPINDALGGHLLLCMSACEGFSACQMAMRLDAGPHPYFALVGHGGKPSWADTAVAYAAFYHLVAKGLPLQTAVAAMIAATADGGWTMETAEQTQRGFLDYFARHDFVRASARVAEEWLKAPLTSDPTSAPATTGN